MLSKHQAVCWAELLFLILWRSPFSRKWLNSWGNGKSHCDEASTTIEKSKGCWEMIWKEQVPGRGVRKGGGSGSGAASSGWGHLGQQEQGGGSPWATDGERTLWDRTPIHGNTAWAVRGQEKRDGARSEMERGARRRFSVLYWNTELHSMYSWKLLGDGCNWRDLLGCYCYKTWETMKA